MPGAARVGWILGPFAGSGPLALGPSTAAARRIPFRRAAFTHARRTRKPRLLRASRSEDRRELHRVLKNDGWAIIDVPIMLERTIEDPTLTDPAERTRRFGQPDHDRAYGHDSLDRLREAGFKVSARTVGDIVRQDDIQRFGLLRMKQKVFHCTK